MHSKLPGTNLHLTRPAIWIPYVNAEENWLFNHLYAEGVPSVRWTIKVQNSSPLRHVNVHQNESVENALKLLSHIWQALLASLTPLRHSGNSRIVCGHISKYLGYMLKLWSVRVDMYVQYGCIQACELWHVQKWMVSRNMWNFCIDNAVELLKWL